MSSVLPYINCRPAVRGSWFPILWGEHEAERLRGVPKPKRQRKPQRDRETSRSAEIYCLFWISALKFHIYLFTMLRTVYVEVVSIRYWPVTNCDCEITSKPKTARSKRALKEREPKVHENPKTALFIRSSTTNQVVTDALKDLVSPQWIEFPGSIGTLTLLFISRAVRLKTSKWCLLWQKERIETVRRRSETGILLTQKRCLAPHCRQ